MPDKLFFTEEFEEAETGVTSALANASRRMEILDMMKIRGELFGELYIVCYLLRQGSQLTTRNGVCLVQLRMHIFKYHKTLEDVPMISVRLTAKLT